MNTTNTMLSRLLNSQPMDVGTQPLGQPLGQSQQSVAQVAMSDSERRRQEIAAREEARQKKARERLASRQADMEPDPQQSPMESDNPRQKNELIPPGYQIDDLVGGAKARADDEMGDLDRKPMTEWNKSDWGKMLIDMGGGFAKAKDGNLTSGISAASEGVVKGMKAQDARAEKYNDELRARKQALDDMVMEDEIRRRRTGDERAYDQGVRQDEREYRSGERQQDRLYDERIAGKRRQQDVDDRTEQRGYLEGVRKDERAYAEKAAVAANSRADAKAMQAAAAKNSRDYSSDYVKMATDLNKQNLETNGVPMSAEELDAIIIPQLKRAYGIGTLGGEPDAVIPQPQTLSSGY